MQGPFEKHNHFVESQHLKELKTLRNKFIKGKFDLVSNNSAFLKVICKKEKELDSSIKD